MFRESLYSLAIVWVIWIVRVIQRRKGRVSVEEDPQNWAGRLGDVSPTIKQRLAVYLRHNNTLLRAVFKPVTRLEACSLDKQA